MKNLRLVDEVQNAWADNYSGEQFTQDGGLTDTLHRLARQLCSKPDEDQTDQQLTEFHGDAFGWGRTKESFDAGDRLAACHGCRSLYGRREPAGGPAAVARLALIPRSG